jgi:hypothetical protein
MVTLNRGSVLIPPQNLPGGEHIAVLRDQNGRDVWSGGAGEEPMQAFCDSPWLAFDPSVLHNAKKRHGGGVDTWH